MGFKLTREEYKGLKSFQEKTRQDIKKILKEALDEFYRKQSYLQKKVKEETTINQSNNSNIS